MKALYRKYRPLSLAEVVGQDQVTKPLASSLKSGKISHAYLFIGPRGCGKTSVARILAHEVNGFKYEPEDSYIDIIEIDGASNRGIDDIRELREKAAIAPTSGKYKIYIIDEVHMLTPPAFNALLKTLEEPPAHVIFILATTDAHKVPITIASRAQVYTFKLSDIEEMSKFLKSIADKEKIKIDDDALKIIAKRGGGSFRDSLSLLDQISTLSNEKITKEMVISAMGLPDEEKIADLLLQYTAGDLSSISNTLKELMLSGIKPEILSEEMIKQIIESPKPETLPLLAKLAEVKSPFPEARLLIALTSNSKINPIITNPSLENPAKPSQAGPQPTAKKMQVTPQAEKNTKHPESPILKENTTNPNIPFNWQEFNNKVKELNDAVYSQLSKCDFIYKDGVLDLYPKKKIVKAILSRENNINVLNQANPGAKIIVHDLGDHPSDTKSDAVIDKISDIMGGKVQNDTGGNPFE
ncbi:DNA polymerase III subunit gamma/tau [Candidatus Saccharibacteria bacterium]|nr:DNA polymerase III subunit gamma/tau [Candidatus Saccharibacteria bacterium]